ncbi:MAG: hypothetical protein U0744_17925 [Gemmataceae bacterium]
MNRASACSMIRAAFAWVSPGIGRAPDEADIESLLHHLPLRMPNLAASGRMIDRPWDLVEANGRGGMRFLRLRTARVGRWMDCRFWDHPTTCGSIRPPASNRWC